MHRTCNLTIAVQSGRRDSESCAAQGSAKSNATLTKVMRSGILTEYWCLDAGLILGRLYTWYRVSRETRMKVLAPVVLGACLLTTLLAFQRSRQYEYEMQNPTVDPPDADEKTEYAFARLRYQSGGRGRRGAAVGGPTQTKRSASSYKASAD